MFLQELALLAEAKSDLEIIEKLRVPADRITELCKDIENVKKQVADQEYKLNTRSQGVRTIKEIESELNTFEKKRYYINLVERLFGSCTLELSFSSMGNFFGSCSPMIFHWLLCLQNQYFLSTCGACSEVVFGFE